MGKGAARRDRQRLRDPQSFVPLGHSFGTGERSDLQLRHTPTDSEMDDAGVLRLAGARRDDGTETGLSGHVEGPFGFGNRTRLVRLDENRVAGAALGGGGDPVGVGDEVVVADDLDLLADGPGEAFDADSVVLG